ncbi:hypothetical protein LOK49_LG04G03045 [Camellia lanceoleosa]|uniref:Uncharacterized protein n=1 Tax=Camellia lanceoleosa TaxID=1840588 RepID=A0ACC0I0J8_9ERIC|nr:hypothetical protein LOK49_LG04G03045 [Camellia lanceoleosa]
MVDLKEGVELMMVCFITQGLFLYFFKRKVECEANDAMEVKLNVRILYYHVVVDVSACSMEPVLTLSGPNEHLEIGRWWYFYVTHLNKLSGSNDC